MTEQNHPQENELERLFVEFAEACKNNPDLNQSTLDLREIVFAAAEAAGVNPSHAFGAIFRSMLMLEYFQKRIEETHASLTAGKLPAFVIEEALAQR